MCIFLIVAKFFKCNSLKYRGIPILLLLALFYIGFSVAHSADVTEQDIRDAILGARTFTQDQLNDMDLNTDGKVDVADVVKFLASDTGKTAVFFETEASSALETAGTVNLKIFFSRPYTGDLHFQILYDEYDALAEDLPGGRALCSAVYGQDYSVPGLTVTGAPQKEIHAWAGKIPNLQNVATVNLPVRLVNNDYFSPLRRIVFLLNAPESSGLKLVSNSTHTLTIIEDDLPAEGYWYAAIGLNRNGEGDTIPVAVSYEFLFSLERTGGDTLTGKVVSWKTNVPDIPILQQVDDNENQQFVPGAVIPIGTPVTAVDNGNGVLTILVESTLKEDAPHNPFPVELTRKLTLDAALASDEKGQTEAIFIRRGIASEETHGLGIHGTPLKLSGIVHLAYYGILDSRAIIQPTDEQIKLAERPGTPDTSFTLYNAHKEEKNLAFDSKEAGSRYFFLSDCPNAGTEPIVTPDWVLHNFKLLEDMRDKGNIGDLESPTHNMHFSYGKYENRLSRTGSWTVEINSTPTIVQNPGSVFLSAAGFVREINDPAGTTPVLKHGLLGAPVAGRAYLPDPVLTIGQFAKGLMDRGSAYFTDNGILKGTKNFDLSENTDFKPAELEASEIQFLGLIEAAPWKEDGPIGVMDVRMRASLAYSVITDRTLFRAYLKKYETSISDTLNKEIEEYESALSKARIAADLMMALYADKQFRGVGAWLRGEIKPEEDSLIFKKMAETRRFTINAVAQVAQTQYELSERRLLKDFQNRNNRESGLHELLALQAYLTEVLHALSPISSLPEFGENGLGRLQGWLETTRSKLYEIRQGLNPFGFVSDFVPFLANTQTGTISQTENLTKTIELAETLILDAKGYEDEARLNYDADIDEKDKYESAVLDLKTTYYDQLRALCGIIENPGAPTPEDRFEPDLYTYPLNDTLERKNIIAEHTQGKVLKSYGRIGLQHENISIAEDRIEQARNDWNNLVAEMEIIAKANSDVNASINGLATVILKNGQKFALFEREKGRLEAEAAKAIADAEKRNNKWGFIKKTVTTVVTAAAAAVVIAGTGGTATPLLFGLAVAGGFSGLSPDGPNLDIMRRAGLQLASSYADYRIDALTATKVGDIKAELAQKTAAINAAREELAAMERAQVQFQRMEENDIRTAERLQLLMLKRANLELELRITEKNLVSEQMKLMDMFAEVDTLLAGYMQHLKLLDKDGGDMLAWRRPDYRVAFVGIKADAEASFAQAHAATWMAIRALEYYLNESSMSSVWSLYAQLYLSRKCQHLSSVVAAIKSVTSGSTQTFAWGNETKEILSLKYHILANSFVIPGEGDTLADANEPPYEFRYYDTVSRQEMTGTIAYQTMLRDFLWRSLTPEGDLEFVFSTDIFSRYKDDYLFPGSAQPENPLFGDGLHTGKVILGYSPPNYPGTTPLPGVEINLVGGTSAAIAKIKYFIELSMEGDMVLRATKAEAYDPEAPMKNLVYYAAYKQQMPKVFMPFTINPDNNNISFAANAVQEIFSKRIASINPLVDGSTIPLTTHVSMVFADRSVANTRWRFKMKKSSNSVLLTNLKNKLQAAYTSESGTFDYITDIQLRIGCVSKVVQTKELN